ncbi:hypothetical protein [Sabulicella rubraurantiaca]|uniref:hypothetical protein n=1 Tax=Sabulicella rubraurantiaca TaxID=2811429 RepID=UPI001A97133F|nr:hypothetical protein [Sabulicella rubraurantiaca]
MFSTNSSGGAVSSTVQDFQSRMGVNTHFIWKHWGQGPYSDPDRIVDLIRFTGIQTVRDGMITLHDPKLPFARMYEAGIKWNFIIPGREEVWTGWDFFSLQIKLSQFAEQYPGGIASIEGANEIWNWPVAYRGGTGLTAAKAHQSDWYHFVKSHPALKHLPVYDFTDLTSSGLADYTNFHHYGPMGQQPHLILKDAFRDYPQIAATGRPMVWTEFGWPTGDQVGQNPKDYPPGALLPSEPYRSVDEATQARFILNGFAQGFRHGFGATQVYELVTPWPGKESEGVFGNGGLFNSDYSPKQSALALNRFNATLRQDDGETSLHLNLRFSLDTADSQVFSQALRSDGNSFKILLWRERDLWDEGLNVPVSHAPSRIGLSLSGEAALSVANPLAGSSAVWDGRGPLWLGDDMLVLEVNGVAPAADGSLSLALSDYGAVADLPASASPMHTGSLGYDTALFRGPRSEYSITTRDDGWRVVQDSVAGRDGTSLVAPEVECLQFANIPAFRFFHTEAGGHLFTTSAVEAAHVRENLRVYRDEGQAFLAADEGLPNAVPVFRFFHTEAGGHLFTASAAEAASVRTSLPHYRDEGIAFHMSATPGEGLAPIFRFFHTRAGGHLFTSSEVEAANVRTNLPHYRDEGIAFYAPTRIADDLFG